MTTDKRDDKNHEKKADTPAAAEKHQRENPNTAKADLDPKDREKDYSKDRQVTTGAKTEEQAKLEDDLWQEQSLSPSNGAMTREQIEAEHPGLGGAASPAGEVNTVDPYVQAQQDLINERAEQNRKAQEDDAIANADDDGETERRIKAERENEEEAVDAQQANKKGAHMDDASRVNQSNKSAKELEEEKKENKKDKK